MDNTAKEIAKHLYDKISLRPEGVSVEYLAYVFEQDIDTITKGIQYLLNLGAIYQKDNFIFPRDIPSDEKIIISLDIPRVSQETFLQYTTSLDALCYKLRALEINVIRPYTHETSLEIVLSMVAGFIIASFFKALFSELGKKLAEFVGCIMADYGAKGVGEIEFKGTREIPHQSKFLIYIKARSEKEFEELLEEMQQSLQKRGADIQVNDEFILKGKKWEISLKRIEE